MTTSRGGPPGPLVLVIEDDDDGRDMYAQYLEWAGFQVRTCRDGATGLRLAAEIFPHVIVMDAGLPRMSGWDVVAELKASALRSIPVLMVTGHVSNEARQQALDAGVFAFLPKPCPPDDLVLEIKRAIATHAVAGGA